MVATLTEHDQITDIYERFIGYQSDPLGFYRDILGMPEKHLWSGIVQVAESVAKHQLTAVPAGHSVSKTYGAGRIVVWFKTCWQPSTVITTAPSEFQVKEQLWRQIRAAFAGSRVDLGGTMTTVKWDLKPEQAILASLSPEARINWENNFAIGFSTSPDTAADNATKMAGWHNQDMLIIIDESGGIHPLISRTIMEGLVTNPRVKVLAIGNATDPNSEFAQWCKPDSKWNVVRISSLDTPNYKERREVIPGLAGYEWVEGLRKKYGSRGNGFLMRCLGEFPTFKEGTYYGFEVAKAKANNQFGPAGFDPTAEVFGFWDLGDIHSVGLFVQFLRGRIRLIDCYYDNKARGLPTYAKVIAAKPYTWNKPQYAGPDLTTSNANSVQTGETTVDIAAGLGFGLEPVVAHRVNDGIEAVRSIWPLLDINTTLCKEAIEAFGSYGKKRNDALSSEDKPVYYNEPSKKHNYHHWADALRHLAIYYRYMTSHGFIGYADEVTADKADQFTHTNRSSYIDKSFDPRGR